MEDSGRVGDSPILGAGLYVDGDVGAAGSTGRGEANLYNLCSFLIVEQMRLGKSPKDAGMEALRRIQKNTVEKRLLNARGLPNFGINFYVVNKKGEYAGVSMYQVEVRGVHRERAADAAVRAAALGPTKRIVIAQFARSSKTSGWCLAPTATVAGLDGFVWKNLPRVAVGAWHQPLLRQSNDAERFAAHETARDRSASTIACDAKCRHRASAASRARRPVRQQNFARNGSFSQASRTM